MPANLRSQIVISSLKVLKPNFGSALQSSKIRAPKDRPTNTLRYNGRVTNTKPFRLTESVKAAG